MKAKLIDRVKQLPSTLCDLMRLHPVEILLLLLLCVGCIWEYEVNTDVKFQSKLCLTLVFAFFALGINQLCGQKAWRWLYYFCWIPLIGLLLWPGLYDWFDDWRASILICVMAPLFIAIACRSIENDQFIRNILAWVRSVFLACLFAGVAYGLFCAMLYSLVHIFGVNGSWTNSTAVYVGIFVYTLVVPMMVMRYYDNRVIEVSNDSKIANVLLNYILTPAIIVYSFALYLFAAKIVFLWSLPRGIVAYIVFVFFILALISKSLQFFLHKQPFKLLYERISLFFIPLLGLFWVGTLTRISEYGLTEDRIWLVVCGVLMSLSVVLLLWQRAGRYIYMCIAALGLLAALVFVPALAPKHIAVCNQSNRAERIAEELGVRGGDGKLQFESISQLDTTHREQLRSLYESLQYLHWKDTLVPEKEKLGRQIFSEHIPESMRDYVCYGYSEEDSLAENSVLHLSGYKETATEFDIDGYKKLYTDVPSSNQGDFPYYDYSEGVLTISFGEQQPDFVISGSQLLSEQMNRCNAPSNYPSRAWLQNSASELVQYQNDSLFVLFSSLRIDRIDSVLVLKGLNVNVIMIR